MKFKFPTAVTVLHNKAAEVSTSTVLTNYVF